MVKIIAIDGPASVGKSAIAKKFSKAFNTPLLSSGRLYRAVALELLSNKNKKISRDEIIKSAKNLDYDKINTDQLYSSGIDLLASIISTKKFLREELIEFQRSFPEHYGRNKKYVIIEGRDIGTVVFPNADYKIFMWARADIRAERRYHQIKKSGKKANFNKIYREILLRDTKDINRKIAPLKPAANSVLLDTSYLDIEQAFNALIKVILK